jgi:MFS transporter, SP family, xylose:H+ symportor
MLGSVTVLAAAFFVLALAIPESPGWLVKHGRTADAERLVARSARPDEVAQILEDLKVGPPALPTAPLFSFGARVILLGVALNLLQQFVGLSAISYYGLWLR